MTPPLKIISSMATRPALSELVAALEAQSPIRASLEAVGGVDAAKRVREGEAFDVVVLASHVIDKLADEGRIVAGSRVDLVRSPQGRRDRTLLRRTRYDGLSWRRAA
jgi:molybdate transport system substrate-binding protein